MTRFALVAVVLAAFAGNAFADGTYILNDKLRRIYVPAPASAVQPSTKAQPQALVADQPSALTGKAERSQIVRTVNDKGRRL